VYVGDEVSREVQLLQVRRDTAELVGVESDEPVVGEPQRVDSVTVELRQLADRRRVPCRAVDRHQPEDRRRPTAEPRRRRRRRRRDVVDVRAGDVDRLCVDLVVVPDAQREQQVRRRATQRASSHRRRFTLINGIDNLN